MKQVLTSPPYRSPDQMARATELISPNFQLRARNVPLLATENRRPVPSPALPTTTTLPRDAPSDALRVVVDSKELQLITGVISVMVEQQATRRIDFSGVATPGPGLRRTQRSGHSFISYLGVYIAGRLTSTVSSGSRRACWSRPARRRSSARRCDGNTLHVQAAAGGAHRDRDYLGAEFWTGARSVGPGIWT